MYSNLIFWSKIQLKSQKVFMSGDAFFEAFTFESSSKMERISPAIFIKISDNIIKDVNNRLGMLIHWSRIFGISQIILFNGRARGRKEWWRENKKKKRGRNKEKKKEGGENGRKQVNGDKAKEEDNFVRWHRGRHFYEWIENQKTKTIYTGGCW